jgi:hypothetical protein
MFLVSIEPTDQPDHDRRTFECSSCTYHEVVTVMHRNESEVELDCSD